MQPPCTLAVESAKAGRRLLGKSDSVTVVTSIATNDPAATKKALTAAAADGVLGIQLSSLGLTLQANSLTVSTASTPSPTPSGSPTPAPVEAPEDTSDSSSNTAAIVGGVVGGVCGVVLLAGLSYWLVSSTARPPTLQQAPCCSPP